MKVTGFTIKVMDKEDHFDMKDVFEEGLSLKHNFQCDLIQSLTAMCNTGAHILIEPDIDYSDEWKSMWGSLKDCQKTEILGLMKTGHFIAAVRCLRGHTGMELKDAKAFVDSWWLRRKMVE